MNRFHRTPSDTTNDQLNRMISEIQAALDARDRTRRRIRIATLIGGMFVVILGFACGTMLRDAYPLLAAAASALGGSVYLVGTFVALVEAASRRNTCKPPS